jgi:hypothetical protein
MVHFSQALVDLLYRDQQENRSVGNPILRAE